MEHSRKRPHAQDRDLVAFWAHQGRWPLELSSSPPPDWQRLAPRSTLASADYRGPRYWLALEARGSFQGESNLGISPGSEAFCYILLENPETPPPPHGSLFDDEVFRSTCRGVAGRSKARIVRDITPLIAPSAELLAVGGPGAAGLRRLVESVNETWDNSIPFLGTSPPQPDYSVGFERHAFSDEQFKKLSPLVGDWTEGDQCYFMGMHLMFFPFFTCEVRCADEGLEAADRQNAHSMTLAARAVVKLFQLAEREAEIDRELLAFSISHDDQEVRIYGEYPVLGDDGAGAKYYRHLIHCFSFTALNGRERWTAYRFTRNLYDEWAPMHFARICSAIDQIPSEELALAFAQGTGGSSRGLESLDLRSDADDATASPPQGGGPSPSTADHRLTPDTSSVSRS